MTISDASSAINVVPEDPGANRVLIVDDDITQRTMLARILRKKNYEIERAMSTLEARSLLGVSEFGLVITDLRMFAQDGIELVRHIEKSYPRTYSIVVSGFVSENDVAQIEEAGALEIMTKPVDPVALVEKVRLVFEHRARESTSGLPIDRG